MFTGWAVSLYDYAIKIFGLIAEIHKASESALPGNRNFIEGYISVTPTWQLIQYLFRGMSIRDLDQSCRDKFKDYVQSEEDRIRANLESVGYDIDATNTLALVTGSGRMERVMLSSDHHVQTRHISI
jgi:hypothetical protein